MEEAIADWDLEPRVVDIFFIVFGASFKRVGVVPNPLLQTPNAVLKVGDDGLMKDLALFDSGHQPFGNGVECDGVDVISLEDCPHSAG